MREFATTLETSPEDTVATLSARIRAMTAQLRDLEKSMKSEGASSDPSTLFELRTALDNARMTAWVMSELANVRQTRIDPHAVSAYVTSERIRRFGQLVKDLCADIDGGQIKAHSSGVDQLRDSLHDLEMRISRISRS
jgi:aromatic ring-cleaving dioxygenase